MAVACCKPWATTPQGAVWVFTALRGLVKNRVHWMLVGEKESSSQVKADQEMLFVPMAASCVPVNWVMLIRWFGVALVNVAMGPASTTMSFNPPAFRKQTRTSPLV